MIITFYDQATEDIYNGDNTKKARKILPRELWEIAYRKLDMLEAAISLNDLKIPPSNHLESLVGDRKGQYSIRINNKYRICFNWRDDGAYFVEITDYHK